ncbi:sensor histidine kinase [Sporosarcina aquimarina]|uniref:histidine kinase n=1 Tax=Sporosarcina aquimarina TaxID=114975 RepID=A0ABU4FZZ2_9BACL|nr:HAMP domain-containing sensor histidine kinase [Sporosarcina aquimarina]MDW0110280.1 HAMP domain-containing sensor histidine kinase [Sporosarcina aquimarina]
MKLTLSKKILSLFFLSLAFTILFSFFFIHFLYSKLYLESIEESIVYQGKRTAAHYHFGELSEDIIEKIQWYNVVSEYEIVVVDQLDDLSSYFPYQVNYENLVDSSDRKILDKGSYVVKKGYVEEFNREILGAIFPIRGKDSLIGFIYIYVPLAAIQDVFKESLPLLIAAGAGFFIILFLLINRVWSSLFSPLRKLQGLAANVSHGDFSGRVETTRSDEIGELAVAFNTMSSSLEAQEERKREFTSNLAHEMRTPLTYISGYTHALKQISDDNDSDAANYLNTIEKETARLSKLINDLTDLNHLQEGLFTVEREPIVVAQLLVDTIDLFRIHLAARSIQLHLDIEEDLIILGDPNRIQQVFYNTIDNAVKYVSDGGAIQIGLHEIAAVVRYEVQNEGLTISKEDLSRMGERFFRTDKARTRTTGGTGLGLSIVKEIVRLHDGVFTMDSDPTSGTIVTIDLPMFTEEE